MTNCKLSNYGIYNIFTVYTAYLIVFIGETTPLLRSPITVDISDSDCHSVGVPQEETPLPQQGNMTIASLLIND